MSKSEASKKSYSQRREIRIRRDKTAAAMLPWCMSHVQHGIGGKHFEDIVPRAVAGAVFAADALLDELDRTRRDLKPIEEASDGPS